MSSTYLVHRQVGSSYLFRSVIPLDLRPQLGRRQFQLSLRCGILKQAKSLSLHLHHLTQNLYDQIRHNSDQLKITIDQLKQILKSELAKFDVSPIVDQLDVDSAEDSNQSTTNTSAGSITLSELSELFLKSRINRGFEAKTIKDYQDSNKLLLEVFGEIPIDSLKHQHGRDYIDILRQLPSNRTKKYPGKSIKELVQMKNADLISQRTITKHVERVSALFNWAIKQGYTNQNVFRGKLESIRKTIVVEKHFTKQELDLVLGDALKAESLKQGKPERYWVTMIAAYSGARLNEICQLDTYDIQQHSGIWVMNLTGDSEDKSIKTHAGNRIVPLHPRLLKLGFLNYVQQIRNGDHQKLFPNLKKMVSTGYGTLISRWFDRYLKRLGIKKKGKNFHSFRHTVVNHLTSKQVYEPFIKELIGHSHGTLTMDVWWKETVGSSVE